MVNVFVIGKKIQNKSEFRTKLLYLGIFGLEFEKAIVIFAINNFKHFQMQSFVQKRKSLNLGLKMPYLGILGLEFENNIVIFEINLLEFV